VAGLRIDLEYDAGVLNAAAAEWLSEQYVQLLGELSDAPEQLALDFVNCLSIHHKPVSRLPTFDRLRIGTDQPASTTAPPSASNCTKSVLIHTALRPRRLAGCTRVTNATIASSGKTPRSAIRTGIWIRPPCRKGVEE